jgi:hypothetical protein
MHDTDQTDARATVHLRSDRYAELFGAIGCTDDQKIAAAAGYSDRTIRRARAGQLGEVFIANTIRTLQQHRGVLADHGYDEPTLDDLFVVVEREAA